MADFPARRSSYGSSVDGEVVVRVILPVVIMIVFIIVSQLIAQSIPEERAVKAAEDFGFTDVVVTSKDTIFIQLKGCGKSDSVLFNVEGTNPAGQKRDFIVCAGWWKGATVRSI